MQLRLCPGMYEYIIFKNIFLVTCSSLIAVSIEKTPDCGNEGKASLPFVQIELMPKNGSCYPPANKFVPFTLALLHIML